MATPVLVTTDNRGVYYGSYTTDAQAPDKIELENARVIVEWNTGSEGFLIMATRGPAEVAEVSVAVSNMIIFGIASIAVCTPEAAAAFDALP